MNNYFVSYFQKYMFLEKLYQGEYVIDFKLNGI